MRAIVNDAMPSAYLDNMEAMEAMKARKKMCALMQVSCNRKHSSIHVKKTNMHEVCIYTKYVFNPASICSFHLACNPCQKLASSCSIAFDPTKHAWRAISKKNNIIQKRYK